MPSNPRVGSNGSVGVKGADKFTHLASIRPGSDSDVFYVTVDGVDVALISPRGITRFDVSDDDLTFFKDLDKSGAMRIQA